MPRQAPFDISHNLPPIIGNIWGATGGVSMLDTVIRGLSTLRAQPPGYFGPLIGRTADTVDTAWHDFANRSGMWEPYSEIWRQPAGSLNHVINIGNILQQSLFDPSQNRYKNVLSEEGRDQVSSTTYDPTKYPEGSCPITQNPFSPGQEVSVLPCGHVFDPEAIKKWLEGEKASCPVCRYQLKSVEVLRESAISPDTSITSGGPTGAAFLSGTGAHQLISPLINDILASRGEGRPEAVRLGTGPSVLGALFRLQIERDEEHELQRAIMASLRDSWNQGNDGQLEVEDVEMRDASDTD